MKFTISARLALLGAGLLLGLPQTASAGVISKKDPCRQVYVPPVVCKPLNGVPTLNGDSVRGVYAPKLPKLPKVPNGICLPKTPTKCPPILVTVLDSLKSKLRCAPVPKFPAVAVDLFRPKKPVDCYVPTPKQPICVTPKKPVVVSFTTTLRDCKPTYGGSTNGPVYTPKAPKGPKPGYGGGGNPTPEPASIALAAMGAAGAIARMRRRREAPEQAKA